MLQVLARLLNLRLILYTLEAIIRCAIIKSIVSLVHFKLYQYFLLHFLCLMHHLLVKLIINSHAYIMPYESEKVPYGSSPNTW